MYHDCGWLLSVFEWGSIIIKLIEAIRKINFYLKFLPEQHQGAHPLSHGKGIFAPKPQMS